jgi:hypothetical protein
MTQKRPLMRFPSWVGVFSASAVNQSSDSLESANGIGDRMTQRQGLSGYLLRAENGGFDWVRSVFPIWDLDPLPPDVFIL